MTAITLGADPEFFLHGGISAHDKVPGTKANPAYLGGSFYGGQQYIQADGTAVELNIGQVRCNYIENENSIRVAADRFSLAVEDAMLNAQRLHKLVWSHCNWNEYDASYFAKLPPVATELGCEPDYNAYTGNVNVTCPSKERPTLRTAAGHIHIGWLEGRNMVEDPFEDNHFNNCRLIVLGLDKMWRHCEPEDEKTSPRRLIYGNYGAFRPKRYGVEWRTPSNYWCFNPFNRVAMARNVLYSVRHTLQNGLVPDEVLVLPEFERIV